jgi:hypothetical protein
MSDVLSENRQSNDRSKITDKPCLLKSLKCDDNKETLFTKIQNVTLKRPKYGSKLIAVNGLLTPSIAR